MSYPNYQNLYDLVGLMGQKRKDVTWKPNTDYVKGQLLLNGGKLYEVVNNFTSGTTFSDSDLNELTHEYATSSQIASLFI